VENLAFRLQKFFGIFLMLSGAYKSGSAESSASAGGNIRYAWKKRAYVVPTPSRKRFQLKVSALRGMQRFSRGRAAGQITIVVPALYNFMPAEALALGWLNEIDVLGTIRHRMTAATKLTGWDVFTFHTHHNLDPFYSSAIDAVRETWLKEGTLKQTSIDETLKRYRQPYHYNAIHARLVENLVFQSSLMEWLSVRAGEAPLRYHVVGTGLLSALVWSGALTFAVALETAIKVGTRWDEGVLSLGVAELQKARKPETEENLGWLRFRRVRHMVEGRSVISFTASPSDLPRMDAPSRPFWFSPTAAEEPVRIETARDVKSALESMNLASWSPRLPRQLPVAGADVKGWLVSSQHPMAATCRWSLYNYLLATPESALMFLDHIAVLGGRIVTPTRPEDFQQDRLRLSSKKIGV
jgi:hypothetical protein